MAGLGGLFTGTTDFLGLTDSSGAKNAAAQAAAAKTAAYNSLQGVDTSAQDVAALNQAKKNYLDQLAFAQQYSPGAYAAYNAGDQALQAGFANAAQNVGNAQAGANALFAENAAQNAGLAQSEQLAGRQSADLLQQGGTLSPEMQAELMRSGFATGANVGGVAGSTAMRSGMARQLASDQLAIQNTREQMAGNLQNQAENIRSARNSALNTMITGQAAPTSIATGIGQQSAQSLESRIPQGYGVGGDTAASNYVSNVNLENQKKLGAAGVNVENINAQYEASRAGPRAAATIIGGILGGYFGGPAGAAAGAGAGAGATAS